MIARTQVTASANSGLMLAARQSADLIDTKTWQAIGDHRTRASHKAASGQTVGLNEKFTVGGALMDRPGDPAGGGAETIECRCTVWFGTKDETPTIKPPVTDPRVARQQMFSSDPAVNLGAQIKAYLKDPASADGAALQMALDMALRAVSATAGDLPKGVTWDEVRATVTAATAKAPATVNWSVIAHDMYERPVIRMNRTATLDAAGNLQVEHGLFKIDPEFQGLGLAGRANAAMEDWYRSMGVSRITLTANIDVGGYAWAKAGWDWDVEEVGNIEVIQVLNQVKGQTGLDTPERKVVEGWLADVKGGGDLPLPFEVAMLGWAEGKKTWPGKEGMLGSFWSGEKRLS
jgi:GNAT superfamily N-acetyltransferase